MEPNAQQMVNELIEQGMNINTIASRLGVREITVQRWKDNLASPSSPALKYLSQVYNGFMANKKSKGVK